MSIFLKCPFCETDNAIDVIICEHCNKVIKPNHPNFGHEISIQDACPHDESNAPMIVGRCIIGWAIITQIVAATGDKPYGIIDLFIAGFLIYLGIGMILLHRAAYYIAWVFFILMIAYSLIALFAIVPMSDTPVLLGVVHILSIGLSGVVLQVLSRAAVHKQFFYRVKFSKPSIRPLLRGSPNTSHATFKNSPRSAQNIILYISSSLTALVVLFPPWIGSYGGSHRSLGWHLIFTNTEYFGHRYPSINVPLLAVEILVIAILGGAAWMLTRNRT